MVPNRLRNVLTLLKRKQTSLHQSATATPIENKQVSFVESKCGPIETLNVLRSSYKTDLDHNSKQYAINFFGISDPGLKRTNNEDHFIVADLSNRKLAVEANCVVPDLTYQVVGPKGVLLAVADGLGGHDHGEIASHITVEALAQSLFQKNHDSVSVCEQLVDAIQEAHRIIIHHAASSSANHAMSSTLTAVHISSNEILLAQVGDSRAYKFSNGILSQISEDQTFVQMMLKKGLITAEEASTHPERHVILQALGQKNTVSPTIQQFPLEFGDRLLLCSDGLSSYVSHETIETILNNETDENSCCHRLLEAAYEGGGGDNITILLARCLTIP